jgi:hypothetical protein
VDTDSAGAVMRRIGNIEDDLLLIESDYYKAAGNVVRYDLHLKAERFRLTQVADEESGATNAEGRKAWVEEKVMEMPEHDLWTKARIAKAETSARFEILSKRLSACQSVLKRHEQAAQGPGVGAGQHNN